MPIEIKDLNEGRGVIITCSGILKGKEYIDALGKHLAQDKEKYKKYRYSLCDYTAVTKLEAFSNSDIYQVVSMCKQAAQINPYPVITLVADEDILFGLSRMWEILMDETGWDIMVFRDRDDAVKWIEEKVQEKFGIDNPAIP